MLLKWVNKLERNILGSFLFFVPIFFFILGVVRELMQCLSTVRKEFNPGGLNHTFLLLLNMV